MSCSPYPCIPCQPLVPCAVEDFGNLFPSLIGPMGPAGGPGTYIVSLAALRALDATIWPSGYAAVVGGYASVNDGGQGTFVYIPGAVDVDNDGTIITPTNGIGRWYRQYTGAVNVQWFGATGDGVTDDYQAIQNAITFVESLTAGGSVFLPASTYLIQTALGITGLKNLYFFGEGYGPGGSKILLDDAINALEMGSGAADRTCDLRIANLLIDGANLGEIGIVVNRLHQILIDRVRINNCVVGGIDLNQAYNNEIRDVYIDNCERGIIADENNEYTLITRPKIFNCASIGIHFRNGSCSGSKVMFGDIEANDVGIQVDAGTVENCESFGVFGCYFKDQTGANALFGTDASAFWIDSVLFQNNVVKAGAAGPATCNVTFGRCRNAVSMSNTFNQCDVITTADCSNFVTLGNSRTVSAAPTQTIFGNDTGNLQTDLPTVDPAVTGELWNDGGIVTVSP